MADEEIEVKITFNTDTSQLDGIEDSLERIKDKSDEAGETIESMTMMEVGQAMQQYGASAELMAQGMNQAQITVGQLAIQTGIAEPQMKSLVNSISSADFPQDEAMQYISILDQLGVSSENLGSSAEDIDRISDAFGLTSDTAVSLTGNLYAMGVPADNLQASYGALAYAQSNVAGGVGQFSTTLQRLGPMFEEYGFNVDQAAIISAAATKKWGTGRKSMSNLSSALKEANGDTKALEEALGIQAGTLDNASAVTGEYAGQLEAMAEEEGAHKTILDHVGAAYDKIALTVGDALSPVMGLIGMTGQLAGFGMELNGVWELFSKLQDIEGFSKLAGHIDSLKTSLTDVALNAKDAGLKLLTLGKNALAAGLNALKSVAMWVAEKVALVASTIATYAMAAAQAVLNFIMNTNPILLIAMALIILVGALIWAYYNVDWFRQMVDDAWASITQFAQQIWNVISPAVQWLGDLFNQFTSQLGLNTNDWIQSIIGFILFLPTLPLQLSVALINAIASLLGFKGNFVQTMLSTGINAVSNFINQIAQLPSKLANELQNMLSTVSEWASTLPQKFWDAGVNAVKNFLNALGIHSPGFMFNAMSGELNRIDKVTSETDFSGNISEMGRNMANSFNPNLNMNGASVNGVAGGDVIINVYGDVDNEARIQQIVDAVRKELAWNNTTAGRTV